MAWLDKIPLWLLGSGALAMALAPFYPEPHLLQKFNMALNGKLTHWLDVFDVVFHAALPVLFIVAFIRKIRSKPSMP